MMSSPTAGEKSTIDDPSLDSSSGTESAAEEGASDKEQQQYAQSIKLPSHQVFRNLKNAKRFAIDIGGSLAKIAYFSTVSRKKTLVSDDDGLEGHSPVYKVSETEVTTGRLHFIKFESKYIESCLDFIEQNLVSSYKELMHEKRIKATGGGAYKYKDLITTKLGVQVDKEDEIECLIQGCNFLLKNIPDEVFVYHRHGNPEYKFQGVDHDVFPYLLVNIGSGVSVIKVEGEDQFERIGGTSTGGGTFWGLGSLLTGAKSFDELIQLAEKGDHRSVDMLVKDIYGCSYQAAGLGLTGDLIASSFGKAARSPRDTEGGKFRVEDLARSLLLSISNDIGQIACLHAAVHHMKKIYFGGFFIRGHPIVMHTISYAINFWSKCEVEALFLRHEGYLGAIGAFLKGAEEDAEMYSWGENFAGSSGLQSPVYNSFLMNFSSLPFGMLELDRLAKPLLPCPLLLDPHSYLPDTVDLNEDTAAREYWLQCFSESVDRNMQQAIQSQIDSPDVNERAQMFKDKYLARLKELNKNPCAYGSLTVRSLLDTSSHCLQEFNFTDPYMQQKQQENEQAIKLLSNLLKDLSELPWRDRQLAIAKGILAGNVFDWGAKEVVDIMKSNNEFSFIEAQNCLQARPWLIDDYECWIERLEHGQVHKCAAIFCDNSGSDILLGIFPLTVELLIRGTKVIICANSHPTLNDVTHSEMLILVKRVAAISDVISSALADHRLLVMESGQGSPCLDLRLIDNDLVHAINKYEADLIVLEGMGRAVHTNFYASFKCDSLKVAVLKNRWLANRLGGDMFNIMFKFEKGRRITPRVKPSPR